MLPKGFPQAFILSANWDVCGICHLGIKRPYHGDKVGIVLLQSAP